MADSVRASLRVPEPRRHDPPGACLGNCSRTYSAGDQVDGSPAVPVCREVPRRPHASLTLMASLTAGIPSARPVGPPATWRAGPFVRTAQRTRSGHPSAWRGCRPGDRFGYRGLFIASLIVFTLAGLGCGLAGRPGELISARVAQGLGAGIYYLAVSATTQRLSPGRARSQAFGFLGATAGISTAVGPLIGGALIQLGGTQDGWRWVFLVNLFIGVTEVAAALRLLPQRHQAEMHELDPALLHTAGRHRRQPGPGVRAPCCAAWACPGCTAVNGLPKTHDQQPDVPGRRGPMTRRRQQRITVHQLRKIRILGDQDAGQYRAVCRGGNRHSGLPRLMTAWTSCWRTGSVSCFATMAPFRDAIGSRVWPARQGVRQGGHRRVGPSPACPGRGRPGGGPVAHQPGSR